MQTNTLRGKKQLLIGFTLFSMFFGAGNLIFPPYLGAQAGTRLWLAFAGFAVSAIGLPIAGVVAVARAGGLPQLAERVHPRFAQVFSILVYLSIGPCLAIPRTASTSFAMLEPLAGESTALQWGYSLLFFAVAFLVAQHPEKLTQRLGKILCPALLALILLLFAGCLLHPAAAGYGTPTAAYTALPAVQGILDGYQTMDTLAGLNFGAVIALNIQALGVTEPREVERGTIRAGFLAAGLFAVVYAMLTHIGGIAGAAFPGCETGAETLTLLANALFGRVGQVLLAAIFIIACFNTCVGLISGVSEYFHQLWPKVPYTGWAAFLCPDQYAAVQHRAGKHPRALGPHPQRHLPGCHRPHLSVVPARAVPALQCLQLGHWAGGLAEHPRRPAAGPGGCTGQQPAAGYPRFRLAASGCGWYGNRLPEKVLKKAAARHCAAAFLLNQLLTGTAS